MDIIENIFSWQGWNGITSFALIVTLIYIAKYTSATKSMADANNQMANAAKFSSKVQLEELQLKMRPVVSIYCCDSKAFFFPTIIHNFSMVHAKARFIATININGQILKLKDDNNYSGNTIWQLQAVGSDGPRIQGHLDIPNIMKENGLDEPSHAQIKAIVSIDSWVINFFDDHDKLFLDKNKNPTILYYWNNKAHKWIPDVSPKQET